KNVEELRPAIKEMAEMLNENKNIYDRGKLRFEIEIEELTDGLNTYDDLVENGDYHQAKDVVDKLNEELKRVQTELEEFPEHHQTQLLTNIRTIEKNQLETSKQLIPSI